MLGFWEEEDVRAKGVYTKPTLPKTKLCDHGCYIHKDGRDLMDLVLDYLPLLRITDIKTKTKWRSIQVLCIVVSLF